MSSWRKARRLVALCEQRQNRVRIEMTRIEHARAQSLETEALLDTQIASLDGLLLDQQGRTGVMDKTGLFEIRRHLAVLLSQKNDLRQERAEAERCSAELSGQLEQERLQLLQEEKKRNKYQTWIAGQRRLELQHRALLEQTEIEERSIW
jgi:hypothetical protein